MLLRRAAGTGEYKTTRAQDYKNTGLPDYEGKDDLTRAYESTNPLLPSRSHTRSLLLATHTLPPNPHPQTKRTMAPSLHASSSFHASKPYYRILSLPEPPSTKSLPAKPNTYTYTAPDAKAIKSAYRAALLRAHPDKRTSTREDLGEVAGAGGGGRDRKKGGSSARNPGFGSTIDDVREAYAVLSDAETRAEYDRWLATRRSLFRDERQEEGEEDFVLGLEVWDLADFVEEEEMVVGAVEESTSTSTSSSPSSSPSVHPASSSASPPGSSSPTTKQQGTETETETIWSHACRCGFAPGFVIREAALEDAVGRGESEVLVGCGGCSLWVRVGFGVEEG